MKFIIRQILIAFALISIIHESQCDYEVQKIKLTRLFDGLKENKNEKYKTESQNDIAKNVDMDCIRNFFKLPQNKRMIMSEMEATIFSVAASLKCSDEDKVFKYYFDEFVKFGKMKGLSCMQWHLQRLEPESKLVDNFEINEDDLKECQENFTNRDKVYLQKVIERNLGPLSKYSCGIVTGADDYLKFISKGALVNYGDFNDELKAAELEKLKEFFRNILFGSTNCIIGRFENDPAAYLINDTLNYYLKKSMEPVDFDKKNDPYGSKNLEKVEDTIDHECVKEKLNLPEFGDKPFMQVEAKMLIVAAKSKCIKIDPVDFSNIFIAFAVGGNEISEDGVSCANYKLKKLEPTSKLIKTITADEDYEYLCEYFNVFVYSFYTLLVDYEDSVGRLNETTRGTFSEDDFKLISYKTFLLASETDKELKKGEIMELFTTVTDKLHKLADCIVERIK